MENSGDLFVFIEYVSSFRIEFHEVRSIGYIGKSDESLMSCRFNFDRSNVSQYYQSKTWKFWKCSSLLCNRYAIMKMSDALFITRLCIFEGVECTQKYIKYYKYNKYKILKLSYINIKWNGCFTITFSRWNEFFFHYFS